MRLKERCWGALCWSASIETGRARDSFTGEGIFELGGVFIEVGSEAFCWGGNREQIEGKRPKESGKGLHMP